MTETPPYADSVPIWDLPLRLFHWLLAAAVLGAIATGWIGGNLMPWHGRLGSAALGLVVFRLVWGVLGTDTARFGRFVRGPDAIRAYLDGRWQGVGHNPLGALSVLAMLAAVGIQAASGHFAHDDIAFAGPLADRVGSVWRDRMSALHDLTANLVLALVGLHLAAIAYYRWVKKRDLVRAMLTGRGDGADGPLTRTGGGPAALVFALALALVAVWLFQGGWLPPPVAAPAPPPDW